MTIELLKQIEQKFRETPINFRYEIQNYVNREKDYYCVSIYFYMKDFHLDLNINYFTYSESYIIESLMTFFKNHKVESQKVIINRNMKTLTLEKVNKILNSVIFPILNYINYLNE